MKPQKSSSNPNKIYWYSFGITIAVVIIVAIFFLLKGSSTSVSDSDGDSPPALPFDDDLTDTIAESSDKLPSIPSDNSSVSPPSLNNFNQFIGTWRIYSSRLFYDSGGGGAVDTTSTQTLKLKPDNLWEFGSSSGTWSVSDISEADWAEWKISSYGPSRKLVLNGWKSESNKAGGPIEEETQSVDFLWIIYRTISPTPPGQVQTKMGH